jgi:hypothetical protein
VGPLVLTRALHRIKSQAFENKRAALLKAARGNILSLGELLSMLRE